jgi:hypothetical protein
MRLPSLLITAVLSTAPGVALAQATPPARTVATGLAPVSPGERLALAAGSAEEIREADRTVARLLEGARKAGSAEAVECIVSRQTAVRALLTVAQTSSVSLKDALARGATATADLQYRQLALAVSKTRMLVAESQRCVAKGSVESGATVVDWASALTEVDALGDESVSAFDLGIDPPEVTPFL